MNALLRKASEYPLPSDDARFLHKIPWYAGHLHKFNSNIFEKSMTEINIDWAFQSKTEEKRKDKRQRKQANVMGIFEENAKLIPPKRVVLRV